MKKFIQRKRQPDPEQLGIMRSQYLRTSSYHCLLECIYPGCRVIAEYTGQSSEVLEIIRDRHGIPACLKVKYETKTDDGDQIWGYDYIPIDQVTYCREFSLLENDESRSWMLDDGNDFWEFDGDDDCECCKDNDTEGEVVW